MDWKGKPFERPEQVIISLATALWHMVQAIENQYDVGSECTDERELLEAVNDFMLSQIALEEVT